MTMQSQPRILYHEDNYFLFTWGGPLFKPSDLGINTVELTTACTRGFESTYEINESGFFLTSLVIAAEGGLYPLINDTPPSFLNELGENGRGWSARYDEIGLRIPFTGKIQFCKDHDQIWNVDKFAGFQVWMFFEVWEAVIKNGYVKRLTNISEKMAKVRARKPYSLTVNAWYEETVKRLSRKLDGYLPPLADDEVSAEPEDV